jgi:hypothetical protein
VVEGLALKVPMVFKLRLRAFACQLISRKGVKAQLERSITYYLCIITNKVNTMGIWKQIAEYLYIRKRDPNEERTQWMKYMHGMNRISLIMFLVAVIIIIIKMLTK